MANFIPLSFIAEYGYEISWSIIIIFLISSLLCIITLGIALYNFFKKRIKKGVIYIIICAIFFGIIITSMIFWAEMQNKLHSNIYIEKTEEQPIILKEKINNNKQKPVFQGF